MRQKYAPLRQHLERQKGRPELLTFEDIEDILGAGLPPSALKHRAFWANDNTSEAGGCHTHARAWAEAGYRVAWVDREDRVVRFERTR